MQEAGPPEVMQESGVLEEGTRDILQEEGVQLNNSISASQEAREEDTITEDSNVSLDEVHRSYDKQPAPKTLAVAGPKTPSVARPLAHMSMESPATTVRPVRTSLLAAPQPPTRPYPRASSSPSPSTRS